jgi:ElaB/YqjD/DUF883 family membrane-anchored ribosome-binding protein
MAANQTSRHKSSNHRNQAGQFTRSAEVTERKIQDMAEEASDYVSEAAEETQDCIRDHSGAAVMVSLVAGLGIGLLVGKAIGASHAQPKSRRYREVAENFGSRLMERIEAMVPDALAEHFNK